MHELVRPNFHKPIASKRLPSFAGQGLPERMRSTVFVFLGLTAAAGLGLVAIFAQLGFPLLSPAPMPSDPSQANAVAEAEPLGDGPKAVAVDPARSAATAPEHRNDDGASASGPNEPGEGDAAGVGAQSAPVSTPAPDGEPGGAEPTETPAQAPEPSPAPSPVPTSSAPEPAPEPEAAPAAPPAPEAKPASTKPPKSQAKPAKSKPVKPEAKPAKSKPDKPEPKPAKAETKPAPEPAYEPAPAPAPPPTQAEDKEKEKSKGKK